MTEGIKHTAKLTLLFISVFISGLILAALLSVQTAFAAFSFSSDVVGVGKVQSNTTITQVSLATATEKLDVASTKAIAPAATLAAPSERKVKEEPIVLPCSWALTTEEMDAKSLNHEEADWFAARSTVYDDGTRDPNGLTCAVDMSMLYLKGSFVEINYGGQTITVLINDVGYLARGNYAFDFMPGLCHAFGFTPGDNPTVYYRIIRNTK